MRTRMAALGFGWLAMSIAAPSFAQTWRGAYVGGSLGGVTAFGSASETVTFDTNLDGRFSDTVRTAAGGDAFSPGFCDGAAVSALAASGCAADEKGRDLGVRGGYDWQWGAAVLGLVVEGASLSAADTVTAFSTTPAFYSLSREVKELLAFRVRSGLGTSRLLLYGTGGPAAVYVTHPFSSSNTTNTFAIRDELQRKWGYQAGGGAEARLTGPWSVFGEYLRTAVHDLDETIVRAQGPAPATNPFILVNPSGTDLRRSERFMLRSARGGIIYRF